jgi:hypothetical protein
MDDYDRPGVATAFRQCLEIRLALTTAFSGTKLVRTYIEGLGYDFTQDGLGGPHKPTSKTSECGGGDATHF